MQKGFLTSFSLFSINLLNVEILFSMLRRILFAKQSVLIIDKLFFLPWKVKDYQK